MPSGDADRRNPSLNLRLAQPADEVAEWLRRWTANPLGSARVGSNPILVESFLSYFIFPIYLSSLN